MRNNGKIRFFDIFCGAGGGSRGAVLAGCVPVAALDKWDLATTAYKINFPGAVVYNQEVESVSPKRVIQDAGKINLLLASPECTNHSIARGNKPSNEKSRSMAFKIIRFLEDIKPRWFVIENVIQMRRWNRFTQWENEIHDIGYYTSTNVLDSKFFGTPQTRRRLFIIGDLKKPPVFPKKGAHTKRTVLDFLGRGDSKKKPWVFTPALSRKRAKNTILRIRKAIKELNNPDEFLLVYYGTDGAGGFQTLDRPIRTITTIDRFAYVRMNGSGYEMRMLQPSELAAAMGFPAYHKWPQSTRRERIKLIGNAVCPRVMRSVVKALTDE